MAIQFGVLINPSILSSDNVSAKVFVCADCGQVGPRGRGDRGDATGDDDAAASCAESTGATLSAVLAAMVRRSSGALGEHTRAQSRIVAHVIYCPRTL